MKINEIFYSIQGEGISAGKPRLFIRLSGCNLRCNFCDTKYHIKGREINKTDQKLLEKYDEWCITGGEPLLQQQAIMDLIDRYSPYKVEIETNGTIIPEPRIFSHINQWNISPKEKRFQPKQCNPEPVFLTDSMLSEKNTIVKFVYSDLASRKFIKETIKKYNVPDKCVWIMPEGQTKKEQEQKAKQVWSWCLLMGYNFSPRLQVNLFNKKKGI